MKVFLACILILMNMKPAKCQPSIMAPEQKHQPMEFAPLREADVMWAKRIWRVIDLNEKINSPLRYPLSNSSNERKNLIDILLESVVGGELTAYSPLDDAFTMPLNAEEIKGIGGAHVDSIDVVDPNPPYNTTRQAIQIQFSPDKVIAYRLKEDWIFDKQRSEMIVRIIGIAPLMYAENEKGERRVENILIPIFWIYYPEVRNILANQKVLFNQANNGDCRSFDDLFQKRMFGSVITKESNVYDRTIAAYTTGLSSVLESEKIKKDILFVEHDLWEY